MVFACAPASTQKERKSRLPAAGSRGAVHRRHVQRPGIVMREAPREHRDNRAPGRSTPGFARRKRALNRGPPGPRRRLRCSWARRCSARRSAPGMRAVVEIDHLRRRMHHLVSVRPAPVDAARPKAKEGALCHPPASLHGGDLALPLEPELRRRIAGDGNVRRHSKCAHASRGSEKRSGRSGVSRHSIKVLSGGRQAPLRRDQQLSLPPARAARARRHRHGADRS